MVICNGYGSFSVQIDGLIDTATVEAVRKFIEERHAVQSKCDTWLAGYQITSPSGDAIAAMALGRLLRKNRASLIVDDTCASARVLALAGAADRHVSRSAKIAIHRPYFQTPSETFSAGQAEEAYAQLIKDIRAYLREMNVSEQLVDDMLAVEPEQGRILTQAELKVYGLSGTDPSERERQAAASEQGSSVLALCSMQYPKLSDARKAKSTVKHRGSARSEPDPIFLTGICTPNGAG
jgi:hypothetical protein